MKAAFFLLLMMSFSLPSAEAKLFTIDEGGHYSSPTLTKIFSGTKMNFSVTFDDSAYYQFDEKNASDQGDTNKLYGFADCRGSHMENSARFGWRTVNGQLEIMAFTHRGGKFFTRYITTIQPNHPYDASIEISPDKQRYIYIFNGVKVEQERGCEHDKALGYHLQPFFGGQQPAPHQVRISIDIKNETGPAFVGLPYPNPVSERKFNVKVKAFDNLYFYFIMYDTLGRLVWKSPRTQMSAEQEEVLQFQLDKYYASGMYFLVPVTETEDGEELRASITNQTSDRSLKLMILNK